MTMRLDIVTNDAGELVRREHARELGSNVVIAIYRLAKLAQMHDLTNQAFLRQLEQTHQAIVEYGLRAGTNVNILFAEKAIFVAGQLLKGSKGTYDSATELAQMLEWCGGSELSISRDVTQQELHQFAEAISSAMRAEKGKGFRSPSAKIRLRPVTDAARLRGIEIENLNQEQRIVRNYASAVVIIRRFFADLQASRYILPRRIKRVAQNLVDLSEGATPAFLGVTESRNQNHDEAGRAVNTAILAVAMARELTDDRVALAQIAMAAMMHDVGRPRAAALGGGGPRLGGVAAKVSEDAEDKLAAGTAAVLTALGRVNEPTITRTVIAFEALWLRRQQFIGPVYRGTRQATLQAKILTIARRYNDLLTPEPGLPPPLPDMAVATLSDELKEPSDKTVLRLLVSALGLFPVGTVVQLSTNEVAEVIAGGDRRAAPEKPRLRLVMDSQGGVFNTTIEVDLASPRPGDPLRRIVKVVDVENWRKGLATVEQVEASHGSGMRAVQDVDDPRGSEPSYSPFPAAEAPSTSVPSIASIKSISKAARESPSGSGVVDVKRASYPSSPSAGTSPSRVAEAMGRSMAHAAQPELPRVPQSQMTEQRTVMAVSPLEEIERLRAEQIKVKVDAPAPPSAVAPDAADAADAADFHVPKDVAPTARGTLASTPIVHVLVYMLDHRLSGTVVLREPEGRHNAVYFDRGAPAKAKTARASALLGDELVALGLVKPESIPKAVESSQRLGTLLGEYLVGNDLISRETLMAALATQVAHKLESMVNLPPETDYAFYADMNLLESYAGGELTPCHPLQAILGCVRAWHDRARIAATLARITKQPLAFHPQSDLSDFTLSHEEGAIVEAIRGARCTITTLYDTQITDEESVSTLVYAFAVTRYFSFTAAKGPPMGMNTAAPDGASPPQSSFPKGTMPSIVRDSAAVREGVSSAAAGAAGMSLSLRPPAVASNAPPATDRRSEAPADVPPLGHDPEDAGVDVHVDMEEPAQSDPEMAEAERAIQAMTDFRLAETALQRNDLATATRLAAKAVGGDPENGEYKALAAWVHAMNGKVEGLERAIVQLTQVLKEDPTCERALLYRGKLFKRSSRLTEATRDFQLVLEVNPKNSEAASELRLLRAQQKKK